MTQTKDCIIHSARITAMPKALFDAMPQIWVWVIGDANETFLFEYYPDEISFSANEFIGLTMQQARSLKFTKDKNFLQS